MEMLRQKKASFIMITVFARGEDGFFKMRKVQISKEELSLKFEAHASELNAVQLAGKKPCDLDGGNYGS